LISSNTFLHDDVKSSGQLQLSREFALINQRQSRNLGFRTLRAEN